MALTKWVMRPPVSSRSRAGGLVVDARVVGVGELVEHPALAVLLHLLGEVARVLHAAERGVRISSAPNAFIVCAARRSGPPA
jgi:hypothetical protein